MDTAKFNSDITSVAQAIRQQLKIGINALSQNGKGKLAQSVATRTRKSYGEIESVSFNFERHGIFFQKGVGRGYTMSGGKVMHTGKGKVIKAREPKDWLAPIDANIEKIAELVTLFNADKATEIIVK